jgi:ribulose-bisphosphate carboxylase small chain
MWSPPMFDLDEEDADVAMRDVRACREAHPHLYVKVVAYDRSLGRQTTALSFIVNRPEHEPGFRLERQETNDRVIRYTIHSYAGLNTPAGERYGGEKNSELAPIVSQSKAKPNGSKADDD